jgi:hypothetical protein
MKGNDLLFFHHQERVYKLLKNAKYCGSGGANVMRQTINRDFELYVIDVDYNRHKVRVRADYYGGESIEIFDKKAHVQRLLEEKKVPQELHDYFFMYNIYEMPSCEMFYTKHHAFRYKDGVWYVATFPYSLEQTEYTIREHIRTFSYDRLISACNFVGIKLIFKPY